MKAYVICRDGDEGREFYCHTIPFLWHKHFTKDETRATLWFDHEVVKEELKKFKGCYIQEVEREQSF